MDRWEEGFHKGIIHTVKQIEEYMNNPPDYLGNPTIEEILKVLKDVSIERLEEIRKDRE